MTISSNNILDPPIINPNWMAEKADVEQAYAAFLRLREIASHWDTVTFEVLPGATVTSKEDIMTFIKDHSSMIFHGTSTSKSFFHQTVTRMYVILTSIFR